MFYLYGEYNSGSVTLLGEKIDSFMILEQDEVTKNNVFLIAVKLPGLKLEIQMDGFCPAKKLKELIWTDASDHQYQQMHSVFWLSKWESFSADHSAVCILPLHSHSLDR